MYLKVSVIRKYDLDNGYWMLFYFAPTDYILCIMYVIKVRLKFENCEAKTIENLSIYIFTCTFEL